MADTTVDDLLAEAVAGPRIIKVRVLLRQALIDEHADLVAALETAIEQDARENREPLAPGIAEQIAAFEAEIEDAKREFVFKRIGKRAWADLLAAHPPTKTQRAENPRIDNNPETFPAAAVAASCVSPVLTVEQVEQFEEVLTLVQWNQIYSACLEANMGGGDSPKSLLAGALVGGIHRANAELGKQPTSITSLDPGSLAE